MRLKRVFAAAIAVLPLAACGSISLPGPAVLAAAGDAGATEAAPRPEVQQPTSPAVGTVIGGILGGKIGRHLDPSDRGMAADAEYRALEYGQSGMATGWQNPATGDRGEILPGKPYPQGDEFCRAYTHTVFIHGAPDTISAVACRKPDGTWRAAT